MPYFDMDRALRLSRLCVVLAVLTPLSACTTTPDTNSADDASVAARSSPLAEYLSGVWGSSPAEKNQIRLEAQARRDEFIVQCMLEAGFEHVPQAQGGAHVHGSQPRDRDWAATWGYGIADSPDGGILFWQPSPAEPEIAATTEVTLTPEQQQAYKIALFGSIASDDKSGIPGCVNEAVQHVPENIWHITELAPLLTALNELEQRIEDDPDVQEANGQWSQCMDAAGFPGLESSRHAFERMLTSAPPGDVDSPAVLAFQREEIRLALADFDCQTAVNLRDRESTARFIHEQQFVERHHEILTKARDHARQLGFTEHNNN